MTLNGCEDAGQLNLGRDKLSSWEGSWPWKAERADVRHSSRGDVREKTGQQGAVVKVRGDGIRQGQAEAHQKTVEKLRAKNHR